MVTVAAILKRCNFTAMRTLLLPLALLLTQPALADGFETDICFDYSCFRQAKAVYSDDDAGQLRAQLAGAADAAQERVLIGQAIGRMYAIAAAQTPIWRDRGRNSAEEREFEGAMDCVDHSTNTDRFLRKLAETQALRFHRPDERRVRYAFLVFGEHWTATVVENEGGAVYAVDAWFFEPGMPAAVVPLQEWRAGFDPGT